MSKENVKKNSSKKNNKAIIAIVAVVLVIIVIVSIVAINKGKSNAVNAEIGTEVWLNVNEEATLKNNDDNITLKIDSYLNYEEGNEFKVPYTLIVNGTEYSGIYTFATGYSIHSEPNNMPYKISFTGIKQGSIGVKISER